MTRFLPALGLIALMLLGLVRIIQRRLALMKDHEFAVEYLKKLQTYFQSSGSDVAAYTWLVQNSPRMQTDLGPLGIISYRPPAADYILHNYQVIVNLVPELRRNFDNSFLGTTDQPYHIGSLLEESLLRHVGVVEHHHQGSAAHLRNPVVWLREGVRTVLALPFLLSQWSGLTGAGVTTWLTDNFIFRALSGLATLATIAAALVTVVIGWDEFRERMTEIYVVGPPSAKATIPTATATPTATGTASAIVETPSAKATAAATPTAAKTASAPTTKTAAAQ